MRAHLDPVQQVDVVKISIIYELRPKIVFKPIRLCLEISAKGENASRKIPVGHYYCYYYYYYFYYYYYYYYYYY